MSTDALKVKLSKLYFSYAVRAGKIQCRKNNFNGWKRIYHFHVRKTAGTSLNHMFLALSGLKSSSAYRELTHSRFHLKRIGKFLYAGWDKDVLVSGCYFYGFSHLPYHQLRLPPNTYRIAIFRDPVERVMSHYNMLKMFKENHIDHPCMTVEGEWLGESFEDFIENIPDQHLMNQLYMFSECYDVSEAVEHISNLENFFFTEDFERGVEKIRSELGIKLKSLHLRRASSILSTPEPLISRLKERLSPEYEMLHSLRNLRKHGQRPMTQPE